MVQDTVEDGGSQGAVVVEDLHPVFVGAVGGDSTMASVGVVALPSSSRTLA
jgi:hypothetical protein